MAVEKPWIGSRHQKESAATMGVQVLDSNRTIYVAPLNDEQGDDPTPERCRTMSDVFKTYKPAVESEIKTLEGESAEVNLTFNEIKDFAPQAVVDQSDALSKQQNEMLMLQDFVKQVGGNPQLRKALDNPEQRANLIQGLRSALAALGGTDDE